MLEQDAKALQDVLKELRNLELAIAELYRAFGETGTDREFWSEMEISEEKHALYIERMLSMIVQKPDGFEKGRQIKPAAIQTVIAGVRQNIQKIRRKEIGEEKMLYLGRDIEQSILERSFCEMVKSRDAEYQSLVNEIIADTLAHRQLLNRKIKEIAA